MSPTQHSNSGPSKEASRSAPASREPKQPAQPGLIGPPLKQPQPAFEVEVEDAEDEVEAKA